MPVSVLLVDSEATHAQAAVRALDDAWLGWRVEAVSTVAQARHRLASAGIDVIIAAERVEDGSAFDLLEAARGIPVLMAVAQGGEETAALALRHGFSDFLVRDAAHAYLLALPAQIEAALEHSSAARVSQNAETLLAGQHRLLGAISRAQSLFISGADARAAFALLLDELLSLTHSAFGFVGHMAQAPGEAPRLRMHAVAARPPEGVDDGVRDALASDGLLLDDPACLLNAALASGEPVFRNGRQPLRVCWPAGCPPATTLFATAISVAGEAVAMVGLANRAGGYTPAGMQLLRPVFSTIGQMEMARRAEAARREVEAQLAQATELLVEKTQALEATLGTVAQGITNVDAQGRIRVYNRRYLELLDMPEELLARAPNTTEVVRFQADRGDFGEAFGLIGESARDYVRAEYEAPDGRLAMPDLPELYIRRTRAGRYLEVRTRPLEGGGRVRTFTDVTDYLAAQEALRASEARWRSLTQLSSDWFWEQDAEFRFVRVEGGHQRPLGTPMDTSLGLRRWELEHQGVTPAQWRAHQAQLEAHETFHDFEMQRPSANGDWVWVSISGEPIFDAGGRFTGYRGVARDITERKRAEAEIERLAFFDELTGLPNRRLLLDRVERALVSSARDGAHGALLFLDLDNFKSINDTLGHEWGDRLLVQVAARLPAGLRASDTVARLGGDEFVVVLTGLNRVEIRAALEVETVAQKLLAALNQPHVLDGREVHSTPSIGIALFQGRGQSVQELLQRADIAMYQAKARGRNTLCFFDPDMQAAATARSVLESDMRLGLQRAEFLPHYQPVVDAEGRILGAEALVRWRHPRRGMVPPGEFIALAEQTGLIMPLGRLMLRAACAQLAQWSARPATAGWTLSVNVSAFEFKHADFVRQVLDALDTTGANPARLKLELTESLLLHDVEDSIAKMQLLRKIGVGFSLDDFGTGYSSLSYLKRLPLDQLKIDQGFVRDVLTDPNDAAIACTIVALAHSLGLDVVAEGVETEGQREFLLRNGCRRFQGYLFGRPGPVEQLLPAGVE